MRPCNDGICVTKKRFTKAFVIGNNDSKQFKNFSFSSYFYRHIGFKQAYRRRTTSDFFYYLF